MDNSAVAGIYSSLASGLCGNRKVKNARTNWPLTVLVVILSPILVPLIFLLFLVLVILTGLAISLVYLSIWILWLTRGKDILFVYSDSPIWRDYMLTEMLPLISGRAIVLNWSERRAWKRSSLSVLAFRLFGGHKAFNPLIVLFRPFRRARKYRFWPAFREWKQGNRQAVERLKVEVAQALGLPS
jgi:hypothetical protein